MFEHNTTEHFEAGVDTEQLEWQVQRKVDEGKPGMIGQRKHQWMMQLHGQQWNLSQYTTLHLLNSVSRTGFKKPGYITKKPTGFYWETHLKTYPLPNFRPILFLHAFKKYIKILHKQLIN